MPFTLMKLPYKENALAPVISTETIKFHHGKHHQGYINKLNGLLTETELENKPLEEIILQTTDRSIYNNAAQVFNHNFYWNCMSDKKQSPHEVTQTFIHKTFESFDSFKKQFIQSGTILFGSGWVWLVQNQDKSLAIRKSPNAGCPISNGEKPLLVVDIWEHAYYIDYRNNRKEYLEKWWDLINWEFVNRNLII